MLWPKQSCTLGCCPHVCSGCSILCFSELEVCYGWRQRICRLPRVPCYFLEPGNYLRASRKAIFLVAFLAKREYPDHGNGASNYLSGNLRSEIEHARAIRFRCCSSIHRRLKAAFPPLIEVQQLLDFFWPCLCASTIQTASGLAAFIQNKAVSIYSRPRPLQILSVQSSEPYKGTSANRKSCKAHTSRKPDKSIQN